MFKIGVNIALEHDYLGTPGGGGGVGHSGTEGGPDLRYVFREGSGLF